MPTVLGVDGNATINELRAARNLRAMVFHPDRLRGAPESTRRWEEDELKKVNVAFDVLTDPARRQEFDSNRGNDDSMPSAALTTRNQTAALTTPEREQLVIYAREVAGHFQEERRLRKQLEESNSQLMKMLQLGAKVNQQFQERMSDQMSYSYERGAIAGELESFAAQVHAMTNGAQVLDTVTMSARLATRARDAAQRIRSQANAL
jgi:DnaJ-class molecular chaperone